MTTPATGPALRDIHLPPSPPWWPPAPGWWLLGALILALALGAGWWLARRWREQRWRRRLMRELAAIESAPEAAEGAALAAALSQLLRRAALLLDRRAAALSGQAWLAFLDARVGGEAFRLGPGRVLADAPFRRSVVFDRAELVRLVRRWLRAALPVPPRSAPRRRRGWRAWRRGPAHA
jgi:hypothetical protein